MEKIWGKQAWHKWHTQGGNEIGSSGCRKIACSLQKVVG